MSAFWYTAGSILAEVDRGFEGAYCLHHQGGLLEAVSTSERSVYFYETANHYILEGR
jgi:hypothetical protein